jgi:hypothetical protein
VEDAGEGEIVTEVTVRLADMTTVAEPDFVRSALLVAVTTAVPAVDGAVYRPEDVTLPSEACHVTALFDVEPWTTAANETVLLVVAEAVAGDTVTEVTTEDAVTVMVATPNLVGSARLVAVTVEVPALAGAV